MNIYSRVCIENNQFLIFQLWSVVFMLRAWRHDIIHKKGKMAHFLAYPTYVAIETNAHSLINFYINLRDNDNLELFRYIPFMQSQSCENVFRDYRSMTTTGHTEINFNLLDVLYKTRRINEIERLEQRLQEASK